jgi:hypothetical protein
MLVVGEELRWLFGVAVTTVVAIATIVIGAFRSLSGRMDRNDGELRHAIKVGDDGLHERINRVKDEYVRRVDLDQRLQHFQEIQAEIRTDIKAIRDWQRKQD